MRTILILSLILVAALATAADYPVDTVTVNTQATVSTTFPCGVQMSLRPTSIDGGIAPEVSYIACDSNDYTVGADGGTCVATITDARLTANTTYDIPVPSGSTSSSVCRFGFITQTGSGVVQVKRVVPRTIPSNLQ